MTAFITLLPLFRYKIKIFLNSSYSTGIREFFVANFWLAITFAVFGLVISCALFCVQSLARTVPTNYVLMFAFTFCEAWVVAFVCAVVGDGKLVVAAAFMTAGIVVALTIYALTTKTDFTVCGGMIWCIAAVFCIFGLFSVFWGPQLRFIYCVIGVIIFSIYLIFDT
jgi:FtsH-binding integral membrane protein